MLVADPEWVWALEWLVGYFVPVGVVNNLVQFIRDKEGLTRQRFHWEPIGVGVEVDWSLF